jgi:hypothetical protein
VAGPTPTTPIRVPRQMWAAYGRVCARLDRDRTEDLLDHMRRQIKQHGDATDLADLDAAEDELRERRARKGGRPPKYAFQRYPEARPWMDEHCPTWPTIAAAIADLGAGLDDAEYVGGVIYLGLTQDSTDPAGQRRVITSRLVRWATRDGADEWRNRYATTTALAGVIDDVLRAHLSA